MNPVIAPATAPDIAPVLALVVPLIKVVEVCTVSVTEDTAGSVAEIKVVTLLNVLADFSIISIGGSDGVDSFRDGFATEGVFVDTETYDISELDFFLIVLKLQHQIHQHLLPNF